MVPLFFNFTDKDGDLIPCNLSDVARVQLCNQMDAVDKEKVVSQYGLVVNRDSTHFDITVDSYLEFTAFTNHLMLNAIQRGQHED